MYVETIHGAVSSRCKNALADDNHCNNALASSKNIGLRHMNYDISNGIGDALHAFGLFPDTYLTGLYINIFVTDISWLINY